MAAAELLCCVMRSLLGHRDVAHPHWPHPPPREGRVRECGTCPAGPAHRRLPTRWRCGSRDGAGKRCVSETASPRPRPPPPLRVARGLSGLNAPICGDDVHTAISGSVGVNFLITLYDACWVRIWGFFEVVFF